MLADIENTYIKSCDLRVTYSISQRLFYFSCVILTLVPIVKIMHCAIHSYWRPFYLADQLGRCFLIRQYLRKVNDKDILRVCTFSKTQPRPVVIFCYFLCMYTISLKRNFSHSKTRNIQGNSLILFMSSFRRNYDVLRYLSVFYFWPLFWMSNSCHPTSEPSL